MLVWPVLFFRTIPTARPRSNQIKPAHPHTDVAVEDGAEGEEEAVAAEPREAHQVDGGKQWRVPDVPDEEFPQQGVAVLLGAAEDDEDGGIEPQEGEFQRDVQQGLDRPEEAHEPDDLEGGEEEAMNGMHLFG